MAKITDNLTTPKPQAETDSLAPRAHSKTYGSTFYSDSNQIIPGQLSSSGKMASASYNLEQNGEVCLTESKEDEKTTAAANVAQISSKKKKVLLITMAIMDMSGGMLFGMIGPFFPTVAKSKNATPLLSGIVLGSYEFTMIFAAPIMGNFIARIGVRYAYAAGIILTGICSIIFGVLIFLPDNWFIPMCVLVRVLQGTGFAAFVTSSYAVLVSLFTDQMAQIFGILETVKGVGFMLGPVIGSGLYALGGYTAPFATMGVLIIIVGVAVSSIIPKYAETMKSEVTMLSLFTIPMELVCGLIHAALAYMFANVDGTMALHLEKFNLKQIYVGLLFFGMAAGYCTASPLVGKVTDKWPNLAYIMLLVGFFLCGCSCLLAGPVPFLHLPGDSLALFSVSAVLVGLTASTAVVTFTVMFSVARMYDFPDNIDTYGKISGFVEGFYNSGAFVGPILGGLIYQNLGWEWSFPITGFGFFACIFLLFLLLCYQKIFKGMAFTSGLAECKTEKENEIQTEEAKGHQEALLNTQIAVA